MVVLSDQIFSLLSKIRCDQCCQASSWGSSIIISPTLPLTTKMSVLKFFLTCWFCTISCIPYGLVVRIAGFHPAVPGSIPGMGNPFLFPICFSAVSDSYLFSACGWQNTIFFNAASEFLVCKFPGLNSRQGIQKMPVTNIFWDWSIPGIFSFIIASFQNYNL